MSSETLLLSSILEQRQNASIRASSVSMNSVSATPSAVDDPHDNKWACQSFYFDSERKGWGTPADLTCEPTMKQICIESDNDAMRSVSDIQPSLEIYMAHGGCVKIWRNVIAKKSLELIKEEMLTDVAFRRCEFSSELKVFAMYIFDKSDEPYLTSRPFYFIQTKSKVFGSLEFTAYTIQKLPTTTKLSNQVTDTLKLHSKPYLSVILTPFNTYQNIWPISVG